MLGMYFFKVFLVSFYVVRYHSGPIILRSDFYFLSHRIDPGWEWALFIHLVSDLALSLELYSIVIIAGDGPRIEACLKV